MNPPHKLRIGELLVQEGFITLEQLEEALAVQKSQKVYKPLGEVCVELKLISRSDLNRILRRYRKRIRLGELLLNLGLVSREQLREALEQQQAEEKKLGTILVDQGVITETALVNTLSVQLGIPKIVPDINLIDKALLKSISIAFLRKHNALPAFKQEDMLTVIMADPLNEEAVRNLESAFGCKVKAAIALSKDIQQALNQYEQKMRFGPKGAGPPPLKDLVIGETNLSQETADNIVEILNYLITNAIMEGASDIHIEPLKESLRVRYRIDGILQHKTDLPIFLAPSLVSRIKVLCELDIAEKRRQQDGRVEARVMDKEIDLRISTYPSVYGENVVIRILHRQTTLIDLDLLGFSPANMARYRDILHYPSGVVLVTGPTGSGKTTTLYASLHYLNDLQHMIITVEDPIEYIIEGVVQGQLNPKLRLSYTDFLKSMMRQDPDVLMIGEIRDRMTAEAVIQAALTGHKVFSTFHTDDTTGALLRLMDMGIDTFLISSTVVLVIAQRLVRVLCPHCRQPYVPDQRMTAAFNICPDGSGQFTFYRARGCARCKETGYKGRTAINELLMVNDAIRDAILARQTSSQIRLIARQKAHLISMREDGFYKATQGITSLEEVLRVVFHNESDFLSPRSAEEVVALCEGKEAPCVAQRGVSEGAERIPLTDGNMPGFSTPARPSGSERREASDALGLQSHGSRNGSQTFCKPSSPVVMQSCPCHTAL